MIEIPKTVEDYRKIRSEYEELAERIDYILYEILEIKKINYSIIENRAKSIESFDKKLNDVDETEKELHDLAGIRVVGYVRSDVEKIVEIIRENFIVDDSKSKDKSSELDPDRFGYRAIHLICQLPDTRTILPEYNKFKDMHFEIQIKTILEHAWAVIEHDRNYKYKGLPNNIKRDFYLISAALENADNQFESITKRIEKYSEQIAKKTKEGSLEMDIDPITLKEFLLNKFRNNLDIKPTYGFKHDGNVEIKELNHFGIKTIQQLENIIHPKILEMMQKSKMYGANLTGILYRILLYKFQEKYFPLLKKYRGEYMIESSKNELEVVKDLL